MQFASIVCKAYRFPRSTKKILENEIYNLSSTRYSIFFKCNAEGDKLPLSLGAFKNHVEIAYFQLHIWSSANLSSIDDHDPLRL